MGSTYPIINLMSGLIQKTIDDIEEFLERTKMKEREFGLSCANCHKLVKRLKDAHKNNTDIKSVTFDKINNFIKNYPSIPKKPFK